LYHVYVTNSSTNSHHTSEVNIFLNTSRTPSLEICISHEHCQVLHLHKLRGKIVVCYICHTIAKFVDGGNVVDQLNGILANKIQE
jgi:hypothetical protein